MFYCSPQNNAQIISTTQKKSVVIIIAINCMLCEGYVCTFKDKKLNAVIKCFFGNFITGLQKMFFHKVAKETKGKKREKVDDDLSTSTTFKSSLYHYIMS